MAQYVSVMPEYAQYALVSLNMPDIAEYIAKYCRMPE